MSSPNRLSNTLVLEKKMSALSLFHNESINDFFYNLHDTTLSEILKRLQVKDLLRCRCVQKSWYYVIKTPNFIKLHFKYHKKHITTARDGDDKYLLFRWLFLIRPMYLRYDDEQCQEFNKFEPPSVILEHNVYWFATSTGLVCVATFHVVAGNRLNMSIYLWNPLINKFREIPDLDLSHISPNWTILAFGYVPSIDDYQIVRIVNYFCPGTLERSFLFRVYSLNTNSWKTKHSKAYSNINVVKIIYESVFVNGFSCWRMATKEDSFVLYFDSMNEILGTISLPQVSPDHDHYHCLHQFGQSVALSVELRELSAFKMWILKQDSIKNEFFWEEMVNVTPCKPIYGKVVGIRNNGELVLASKSETVHGLVSYDPENNQVKDFVESWKNWSTRGNKTLSSGFPPFYLYPFVGNLVLLDTE